MIKEELKKQLFDKVPINAKVAIFGASNVGGCIYKDFIIQRPDVKVLNFIDTKKIGSFQGLKILSLKEFTDNREKYDLVIVASVSAQFIVNNILDVYNIPFIPVSKFILGYYNDSTILDDDSYLKVKNIYFGNDDKEIFDLIFKYRKGIVPRDMVREYYEKNHGSSMTSRTIKNQYLDKINKEKVKIVFDMGFNSGINAIAYNYELKNLRHIYAFEAIYDVCRSETIEEFIPNDKLTIVEYAVGEENTTTSFHIDTKCSACSKSDFSSSFTNNLPSYYKEIKVNVIRIDDYCARNNIYPDLIKMDIEGSELPALKGGIKAIKKSRPQLAISIYHSYSDFINIPIYLQENLENYIYKFGHYSVDSGESVLYAIPKELVKNS